MCEFFELVYADRLPQSRLVPFPAFHKLAFPIVRIALQQSNLAKRNIRIPQPFHFFRLNFACLDNFKQKTGIHSSSILPIFSAITRVPAAITKTPISIT